MNPLDIFNSTNGLNDFLTTLYGKSMTSKQKTDGTAMYNKFKSIKNSGGGGGGGITPPTSSPSGGFSISKILSDITKGLTNMVNAPIKFGAGIGSDLYRTQLGQGSTGVGAFGDDTFLKYFEQFKSGGISIQTILGAVKVTEQEVYDQLRKESQLRSEINEKTTLTGELSEMLREDIVQSGINAQKFGYNLNEIGEIYVKLVENTGRFSLLNQKTLDDAAPIVRSFVGDMQTMANTISEFEKVGIGANRTLKTIEEAGVKSMSLGLSGKRVVQEITSNIDKLNQYGFQNGVRGLENMVRKSFELRMNMQNVFNIAETVMDPEGALNLAANLQVLGGAIGDFGDPIRMMYDATNNVEGLQDALGKAAQSLVTYNTEQGRFEITGANLRRARQMAKELGIDLTNTAIASAERMSAMSSLLSSGLKVDDEDKEFLLNMSRMEGGEMKIIIPESLAKKLNKPAEIALDKLDQNTAEALIEYRKRMEQMDAKDIAMNQLTETEQMGRNVDVIAAGVKVMVARQIRGLGEGLLGDEYKTIRDAISEESNKTLKRRGTVNYQIEAENTGKEIREKGPINYIGDKLKENFPSTQEILDKMWDALKNFMGISKLTKNDISEGFYDGMIKYNLSRKTETASINIQTHEDRGYLSKDPKLS